MASAIGDLQSKAAVHAMTKKAEGLLEPLIEVDEDGVSSDDESSRHSNSSGESSVSVEVEQTPMQKLKTALVGLGLGAGVVASAGSMIIQPGIAVFVMGSLLVANVPYSALKEYRIIKLPALRSLNDKLRVQANHLEQQVEILSKEIDVLEPEAARAAGVEEELEGIADEQNYNVDKFVSLVKENEQIISEMRDNLRQRIVQDVLHIVMSSDKNNDGRFSKVETKMLVLKISLALQEYGVEFDQGKFFRVMSGDPSVQQTILIVKRLIPDVDEEGEDSDEEDEEALEMYDMFHMSAGGSSTAPDASSPLSLSIVKGQGPNRRESLMTRQGGTRKKKEPSGIGSDQLGESTGQRAHSQGQSRRRKRDAVRRLFGPHGH